MKATEKNDVGGKCWGGEGARGHTGGGCEDQGTPLGGLANPKSQPVASDAQEGCCPPTHS
jgi:hypothetical protein